ncbi:MAG: hypothetical protein IMW89_17165 [Ktedonobacteraceae bacterium]|nr:hypothetical protein [Ktedonobacteraceae bacterium]
MLRGNIDELVALNAAINFALQYAHYLPPEGKQFLTEFQQRLMRYLSFLSPTPTQTPPQKEPQWK